MAKLEEAKVDKPFLKKVETDVMTKTENLNLPEKKSDDSSDITISTVTTNKIVTKKWYHFLITTEGLIFVAFILPPFAISIISMLHLYQFFLITKTIAWAITLAISFEMVSIASLVALAALQNVSKGSLWVLFILVGLFQIIGNVYTSFTNIVDPLFMEWIRLMGVSDSDVSRRWISILQGAILPILSLSLIKLAVDKLDWNNFDRL